MKTTIDLPDDLLIRAKQVAAQRRTTLKDMVTRSLRREVGMDPPAELPADSPFVLGELGLPVLKRSGRTVTSEMVYQALDETDEKDYRNALSIAEHP